MNGPVFACPRLMVKFRYLHTSRLLSETRNWQFIVGLIFLSTEAASCMSSCKEAILSDCLSSFCLEIICPLGVFSKKGCPLCVLSKSSGYPGYQPASNFPLHFYQLAPILLLSTLSFAFPAHDQALYLTLSPSTRRSRVGEKSIRSRPSLPGFESQYQYSLAV